MSLWLLAPCTSVGNTITHLTTLPGTSQQQTAGVVIILLLAAVSSDVFERKDGNSFVEVCP